MEKYIKDALFAIGLDAEYALQMCRETACNQDIELDWVIEQFLKAFAAKRKESGL